MRLAEQVRSALLRRLAVFVLVATLLDCAGGPERVLMPPAPASFQPRQELEVWQGREAITLHGVRIAGDSLSGVPTWKPPNCDSCRVAVSVHGVDSIRTVHNERSWILLASIPFVALGAVVLAVSAGGD
jgi:hypothetical protein